MPIYDFQCEDGTCGCVFEAIAGFDEQVECPNCGFSCKRLIGVSSVFTANQDAPWIRSVLEVVDKESPKPETREFLKRPTRDNYHQWMRAEGVRPLEDRERRRPDGVDLSRVRKEVREEYFKRNRITL